MTHNLQSFPLLRALAGAPAQIQISKAETKKAEREKKVIWKWQKRKCERSKELREYANVIHAEQTLDEFSWKFIFHRCHHFEWMAVVWSVDARRKKSAAKQEWERGKTFPFDVTKSRHKLIFLVSVNLILLLPCSMLHAIWINTQGRSSIYNIYDKKVGIIKEYFQI